MRSKLFNLILLFICFVATQQCLFAYETNFSKALKNCSKYTQSGIIMHNNEPFTVSVSLEKKKNNCIYKEKVSHANLYHLLTCKLPNDTLSYIYNSMIGYGDVIKVEMQKNKIFEAKMTSNYDIFSKYLANPAFCEVTHSK